MKYHGIHYWPVEIEKVIANISDVIDVIVVGIYSEGNGDAAGAVVIKKENSKLSEQDIIEKVAETLPFYQHLHSGVRFVEKYPQTPNGKSIRNHLKTLF